MDSTRCDLLLDGSELFLCRGERINQLLVYGEMLTFQKPSQAPPCIRRVVSVQPTQQVESRYLHQTQAHQWSLPRPARCVRTARIKGGV